MSLIWIWLNNEAKLFGFSLSVSLPSAAPLCQWSLLVKSYPNAHVQPKQHILKAHVSFQSEWYLVRFAPCSRWFWSVISPNLRNQSHESKLKKTCAAHSSWPKFRVWHCWSCYHSCNRVLPFTMRPLFNSSTGKPVPHVNSFTCSYGGTQPQSSEEKACNADDSVQISGSPLVYHTNTHSRADMMHPPPLGWDDER